MHKIMYRLLMQLLRCTITCRRLSSLDWRWFIRTGGSQRDCTNCSASLDRYPSAVLPHSSCHRFPLFPVSSPKKLAQVSVDITFCFARFFVSLCLSFRLAPSLSIPLPSPISSSPSSLSLPQGNPPQRLPSLLSLATGYGSPFDISGQLLTRSSARG